MIIMSKKDKSEAEKLRDELFLSRKNGCLVLEEEEIKKADEFCEPYKKFLNKAKTEREVVEYAIKAAKKEGFTEFDVEKKYKAGDRIYYNNRNKAVICAVVGKDKTKNGVRIAAAHIDSPRLDLKPFPLYEKNDLALFKTH